MILQTQRMQYEGHNIPLAYHTDCDLIGLGQDDGQGVYSGKNTASEVFLIFTTQLLFIFMQF